MAAVSKLIALLAICSLLTGVEAQARQATHLGAKPSAKRASNHACAADRSLLCGARSRSACKLEDFMDQLAPACREEVKKAKGKN
jgi:hypothetical protein